MNYYADVCKYYVVRALNGFLRFVSHENVEPDTRDTFALLMMMMTPIPIEQRPTVFRLEQAYIDIPKDSIISIVIGTQSLYIAPPWTLLRFQKIAQCPPEIAKAYINFRRALFNEPESRQKEYMNDLSRAIRDPETYRNSRTGARNEDVPMEEINNN